MIEEFTRSLTGRAGQPVLRWERRYMAPPSELWSALTEPERLRRWLGEVTGERAAGYRRRTGPESGRRLQRSPRGCRTGDGVLRRPRVRRRGQQPLSESWRSAPGTPMWRQAVDGQSREELVRNLARAQRRVH